MSADPHRTGCLLLVVEGLFEKSDSIGYDCVYQYGVLKKLFPQRQLRLFARKYALDVYPDIGIENIECLYEEFRDRADATIIYHFCDGWASFEDWLAVFPGQVVVRWPNRRRNDR